MKKRIVITGINTTANKGCWAMLLVAVGEMRKKSHVPLTFTMLSSPCKEEKKRLSELGIQSVTRPWSEVTTPKFQTMWLLFCFMAFPVAAAFTSALKIKKTNPFLQCMRDADLILDLGGDSYSSDYPDLGILPLLLPLLMSRILNKPYYFCAQSIGPFKKSPTHRFLKFLLKDAGLISTRDRLTDTFLEEAGICKNTRPSEDLAFLLRPAPEKHIQQICLAEKIISGGDYTGISVSSLLPDYFPGEDPAEKAKRYINEMAKVCDYLVDKHRFQILFIPHVEKDRSLSIQVRSQMGRKEKALVLKGDYGPDELKGVISNCDFFISSRMHASLAALSQAIPSITLAYNHKVPGIVGSSLGLGHTIFDVRAAELESLSPRLIEKITEVIKEAQPVRAHLEQKLPAIRAAAEKAITWGLDLLEIAGPLLKMDDARGCTGCGSCIAACPQKAIAMGQTREGTLRPRNSGHCIMCRQCDSVCPVLREDSAPRKYNSPPVAAHTGYASDPEVRFNRSSGGLISALLHWMLDSGQVDGVLVVKSSTTDRPGFQGEWVTHAPDIFKSEGSVYYPVALNEAFSRIPDHIKKVCIVGLPCHLTGLEQLKKSSVLKQIDISYSFSLFCGRTPSAHATDLLIDQLGLDMKKIKTLCYRGKGWPSGFQVETHNTRHAVPLETVWAQLFGTLFFLPMHCHRCGDFWSQVADISFGDAWFKEFNDDTSGRSVCLSNTHVGENLIRKAADSSVIAIDSINFSEILSAFDTNLKTKARQQSRAALYKTEACPGHIKQSMGETLTRFIIRQSSYQSFRDRWLGFPPGKLMKISQRLVRLLTG